MKIYAPRWARKKAAEALMGIAMSRQLKLNQPQQWRVVKIMGRLTGPLKHVELSRDDRRFIYRRLVPFMERAETQAVEFFTSWWIVFRHPRLYLNYKLRAAGIKILRAALRLAEGKGDE